jgi:hypothetical protein
MKKVYYENGPDEINVGPKNKQVLMKRGEPAPLDDKIADALLAKPLFKELKESTTKAQRHEEKNSRS